jgi:steroid delta-isomerase-like uncharacterized protein
MTTENKAVVRRFIEEGWNKGNLKAVDELIATDHKDHTPGAEQFGPGREGVRKYVTTYRSAFPDARLNIQEQLAEGDKVVTRWIGEGTHRGELIGIPPTGKKASVPGITIDRVQGGKIVESWGNWDRLGLMQQLGAMPEREPAGART